MSNSKWSNRDNKGSSGFTFISLSLPRQDEKLLAEWVKVEMIDMSNALEDLTLAGYKVSISADTENKCFIVTVIGTERTVNNNKGMSSRAENLEQAVFIALYKVAKVFEWGIWHNPHKTNDVWG